LALPDKHNPISVLGKEEGCIEQRRQRWIIAEDGKKLATVSLLVFQALLAFLNDTVIWLFVVLTKHQALRSSVGVAMSTALVSCRAS
jgi:hypothetical protein